jgi:UDP-glucose 4-epimerase
VRLLITGGAGCLGAALVEHYAGRAQAICVVDNFATGHRANLPTEYPGLEIWEGSVADPQLVDAVFARFAPSHVIHAAASYQNPEDWLGDARTNVEGSILVAQAARRAKVRRVINFQTVLCYGRPERLPIPEDHPLRPFSSYGISKTAGEMFMLQAGLPLVSLRLANVTGPRLAIGPIPTFYKRLKAAQSCFCSDSRRDFLHMSDFLDLMDVVMAEDAPTGIFNISSGQAHSIAQVFDAVSAHLGITPAEKPPVVPVGADDVSDIGLDQSHTLAVLGWQARRSFAESIGDTLRWYDRHGIGAVFSHLKAPDRETAP